MVMGGDSRKRGHGFEFYHWILAGRTFFSYYIVKKCNVCLKRPKINHKRGRGLAI